MGNFWETRGGVRKSAVLEHKSDNITVIVSIEVQRPFSSSWCNDNVKQTWQVRPADELLEIFDLSNATKLCGDFHDQKTWNSFSLITVRTQQQQSITKFELNLWLYANFIWVPKVLTSEILAYLWAYTMWHKHIHAIMRYCVIEY